jgi:hypothetical protein
MLGHSWEPATTTIIAKKYHESSGTSGTWEYVADIAPDSGAPRFRAKLKQPPLMSHVIRLAAGDTVRVLADVKHQDAKFDKSDSKVSGKRDLTGKDAFDAALREPPGTPPPGTPPPGAAD